MGLLGYLSIAAVLEDQWAPQRERGERVRRVARRLLRARADGLADGLRLARNARREFHPIFVCGAMGSGTSLLAHSLAQRLDIAGIAPESARQVDPGSFLHSRRIRTYPSIADYHRALLPDRAATAARARRDLLRLYRSKAMRRTPWFVDKAPNASLVRAALLAEAFPKARFVLLFRDPVANIEGFRRKWETFGREPLEESIRFYAEIHERFVAESAAFADRVFALEYEALTERYQESLDALASWLGVAPTRHGLRLEDRANQAGRGIRNVNDGRISVVHNANARAYQALAMADIDAIRKQLDPLHTRLRALAAAAALDASAVQPAA